MPENRILHGTLEQFFCHSFILWSEINEASYHNRQGFYLDGVFSPLFFQILRGNIMSYLKDCLYLLLDPV